MKSSAAFSQKPFFIVIPLSSSTVFPLKCPKKWEHIFILGSLLKASFSWTNRSCLSPWVSRNGLYRSRILNPKDWLTWAHTSRQSSSLKNCCRSEWTFFSLKSLVFLKLFIKQFIKGTSRAMSKWEKDLAPNSLCYQTD